MASLDLTLPRAIDGCDFTLYVMDKPELNANHERDGRLLAEVLRIVLPAGTYQAMVLQAVAGMNEAG